MSEPQRIEPHKLTKRIRPYRKTIPLGKDCAVCGKPIFSNRRDRIRQAVACSRECLNKHLAKRMRERPIRLAKYSTGKHIGTGGYMFVNINSLPEATREFARTTLRKGVIYIQEHRAVMMTTLGRALKRYESVHHIDGDKLNNSPTNLELWVVAPTSGVRATELRCLHCGKTYA